MADAIWGARRFRRHVGRLALLVGFGAMMIPVYWLVRSAFSTDAQLFRNPPVLVPMPPSPDGFLRIVPRLVPDLGVSAVIALGCVVLVLAVALPTAYGLNLLRGQRGSGISRLMILSSLMLPPTIFVIPLYTILHQFNLLNTMPGLIIACSVYSVPLAIIVIYTYMGTIPDVLTEAATVDGAGRLRIFLQVVCPLSLPAIATSAIFAFLLAWGDFLFAVTFGAGRGVTPATINIYGLVQGATGVTAWPEIMAGSVLLSIPALLAVLFAQRYITSGLTAGAVK